MPYKESIPKKKRLAAMYELLLLSSGIFRANFNELKFQLKT